MSLGHTDTDTTLRTHFSFILQAIVYSSAESLLDIICISFPMAARTDYHKLSGLKQHKFLSCNIGGQ